jgi:hypothetical protein
MNTSSTTRDRRRAPAEPASPKSTAAQPKRDVIDDNKRTSLAERVVESNPAAEAHLPPGESPITDDEVVLNTAAAVAVPHTRWWTAATRVVASAVRRIFVSRSADSRPKPSYHPARYTFLENALMSREMDRL